MADYKIETKKLRKGDIVIYTSGCTKPKNHFDGREYEILHVCTSGYGYLGKTYDEKYADFHSGSTHPEGYCWIVFPSDVEVIKKTTNNTIKNMTTNLVTKFKLALKSEPEKSFIEKGVMNLNEELTTEGRDLFNAFLFEKHKAEFKTEVVDKIEVEKDK